MALHFQQVQRIGTAFEIQFTDLMRRQKAIHHGLGAIEHHIDVVISRRPGIAQNVRCVFFVDDNQLIAQPVQRLPQRFAPLLLCAATTTAAAIVLPAIDPVGTTPGRYIFENAFPGGGMQAEVMCKIGHLPAAIGKLTAKTVGDAFFFARFVVTKGFAIGRNRDQLSGAIVMMHRERQTISKGSRSLQNFIIKTHLTGDRPVVKKDIEIARSILIHKTPVRTRRVDLTIGHIEPRGIRLIRRGKRATSSHLRRREDHKP